MKRLLIIMACLLLIVSNLAGQKKLSFGVGFGSNMRNNIGQNIIADSIIINAEGSTSLHAVYRVFGEYQLSNAIHYNSAINFSQQFFGYSLYNKDELFNNQFIVDKAATVGAFNVHWSNFVSIKLPIFPVVDVSLLAGIRANFLFPKDEPDQFFRNGTRHQGLSEVINNSDKAWREIYTNYLLGFQIEWKRFILIAQFDRSFGSITNELVFFDHSQSFNNRTETLSITLNYRIFDL